MGGVHPQWPCWLFIKLVTCGWVGVHSQWSCWLFFKLVTCGWVCCTHNGHAGYSLNGHAGYSLYFLPVGGCVALTMVMLVIH